MGLITNRSWLITLQGPGPSLPTPSRQEISDQLFCDDTQPHLYISHMVLSWIEFEAQLHLVYLGADSVKLSLPSTRSLGTRRGEGPNSYCTFSPWLRHFGVARKPEERPPITTLCLRTFGYTRTRLSPPVVAAGFKSPP
jgi:hypothetical protein